MPMKDERERFHSQRFNHLIVFYLDTDDLCWASTITDKRFSNMATETSGINMGSERACCIYNQDGIIFCGDEAYTKKNEITNPTQYMDGFLARLYQMYMDVYVEKIKHIKEECKILSGFAAILHKALHNFLQKNTSGSTATLRYIFIVPNHWNTEFRNTIIRPAFTEAGYISNQDSPDRLLFYTNLECQVQLLQMSLTEEVAPFEFAEVMKKNRHCLLREIYYSRYDEIAWETITSFDAVERNALEGGFLTVKDFKVLKTSQVQDFTEAYTNLEELLINHGIFNETFDLSQQKGLLEIIMEEYLTYVLNKNIDDPKESLEDAIHYPFRHCVFKKVPRINKSKLDTITETDLEQAVFSHYFNEFSKLNPTPGDNKKLAVFSFYVEQHQWKSKLLRLFSHCLTLMLQKKYHTDLLISKSSFAAIKLHHLASAAFTLSSDAARLSDLKSPINIISLKDHDTAVLNKAKVIVHIDISLKSVSASYSSNKRNSVRFNSGNLAQENQLLSLEHFFKIDRQDTLLTVEQWVKEMMDNEFSEALTFFSAYDLYLKTTDDSARKKTYTAKKLDPFIRKPRNYFENMSANTKAKISSIFTAAEKDATVNLKEERYKNTFMMIYLKYLVDIVYRKIGEYPLQNIRYFISIEKLLLRFCFDDSHDRIKEIAQACGIPENLKIVTQGDDLLSSLQKECQIEMPAKSYFVQAQLYEDYLYTTLYQVVEESAAITLKSNVIPLDNLYEAMAAYMWNYIQENQRKVHHCKEHVKSRLDKNSMKRFLSYFKTVLFKNFVENTTLSSKIDKETRLQISDQCNCHFYMTYRNIMELIIEPIFLKRAIAEAISITTSKAYYGHHRIHRLFFISFLPSLHHTMQLLMDNYLEDHQLYIQAYIISKPIHQLLIPTSYFNKSPYQVSNRNLGLRLYSSNYANVESTWFTKSNRMLQKNEFPLILAKGEPVLEGRVIKRFLLDPPDRNVLAVIEAIDDNASVVRYPDGNSVAVDPPSESVIYIKSHIRFNRKVRRKVNIIVVVEFRNYASDIKIWMEFDGYDTTSLMMVGFNERKNTTDPVNVAELLTVAYI